MIFPVRKTDPGSDAATAISVRLNIFPVGSRLSAAMASGLGSTSASASASADFAAWDALVAGTSESGFMQSSAWASFKLSQDFGAALFTVYDNDVLVGGCFGYFSSRMLGARLLVSPEGPVMPWANEASTTLYMRRLTASVSTFCRENSLAAWRVEPRLPSPLPAVLKNLSEAPIELVPRETLYLPIDREPDALLAAMHHKARYNIGLASRQGVVVSEASASDSQSLEHFYALLLEASQRDGFFLEPQSFFEDLLQNYSRAKILLAWHENDLLGASLVVVCGGRATYLYGGVSNGKRNLMAGYLLQWQSILAARAMGASVYDFYGYIEEADPNHLYCQFSQFKRKFGGTPIRFCGPREQFFIDTLADTVVKAFTEISAFRGD